MKVTLKDILKLKSKNVILVFLTTFLSGFLFFLPILALYIQKELFTLTNVAIIFAIGSIAELIFRVPIAAFSDLYGRKKSIILSFICLVLAIVSLYIGGSFWAFAIFEIFYALFLALALDIPLIYDTLKMEKKERYFKKVSGVTQSLWPIGAATSAILGGIIAAYSLKLSVGLSIIPVLFGLFLALFLEEPKIKRKKMRKIHLHIANSSKFIIKNRQLVLIILGMLLIFGLSESTFKLNSIFYQFKGIPIIYFGFISALGFFLSFLGFYFSHEISEKLGNKTTILASIILAILLTFAATLNASYLAAIFYVMTSFVYGLRWPVMNHLINIETPSIKRATVSSISAVMISIGTAAFSLLTGFLAQKYNINIAYMISAGLMVFALILFALIKEKE